MDCPIQYIPSRIGLPSARGRQVSAALGKVHSQQAAAPRTNAMPLPALHYEAYEALQVRAAIWNCGYMAASSPLRGNARCRLPFKKGRPILFHNLYCQELYDAFKLLQKYRDVIEAVIKERK